MAFPKRRPPVISVDPKQKARCVLRTAVRTRVGIFKNGGQEWRLRGQPKEVHRHDFPDKTLGQAIPCGVYDLARNKGWVSVGIDHDTAEFAAARIRRGWQEMGAARFPRATKLMITADGGGRNSSRNRLWKLSRQSLAYEIGLRWQLPHS